MNGNSIWIVIVLIIVVLGGWFLLSGTPAKAPSTDQAPVATSTTTDTTPAATTTQGVTVAYTDQGFSPSSVAVPLGTTVTFVNQSAKNMWVASAMHPTHTLYSGTSLSQHCPDAANASFDQCAAGAPGSSFLFTFSKEGTWKYHDHTDATQFGTIIVTAPPAGASI